MNAIWMSQYNFFPARSRSTLKYRARAKNKKIYFITKNLINNFLLTEICIGALRLYRNFAISLNLHKIVLNWNERLKQRTHSSKCSDFFFAVALAIMDDIVYIFFSFISVFDDYVECAFQSHNSLIMCFLMWKKIFYLINKETGHYDETNPRMVNEPICNFFFIYIIATSMSVKHIFYYIHDDTLILI